MKRTSTILCLASAISIFIATVPAAIASASEPDAPTSSVAAPSLPAAASPMVVTAPSLPAAASPMAVAAPSLPAADARALNAEADNILGNYQATHNGDSFKAKVTKNADGTYKAQLYWVKNDRDAAGNKLLDTKNPDKKLRTTPCDRIVLFDGLKYNAQKCRWDSTKIYEPRRGLKANLICVFAEDGSLMVRGNVGPIAESCHWQRIR